MNRKPLVLNNGKMEQLQAGDTLTATINGLETKSQINDNSGSILKCQAVYTKSNGHVDLAQANDDTTAQVTGLVFDASIATTVSGNIRTLGVQIATTGEWDAATGGTGGLTPGGKYFLDPTTPGMLTLTAPTADGDFVARVGEALSTTEFLIDIEPTIKL